ncbi:MAG: squalene/phytoene synthase family protein [Rhizobiaceae bacterium]
MSTSSADHCLALLREADPDRYVSTLYLPHATREAASALYAFDAEHARIPSLVKEPAAGEIRLQWWREVLEGKRESGGHPVADLLLDHIGRHAWPLAVFDAMASARLVALYHDPMPDRASFEPWAGENTASLFTLLGMTAGQEASSLWADACGHAGVACRIAIQLQSLARDRATGRVYVPGDILSPLGCDANRFLATDTDVRQLENIVEAFARWGIDHARLARKAARQLQPSARLILLPLILAAHRLERAVARPKLVLDGAPLLHPLTRQWLAWRGAIAANGGNGPWLA